MDKLGYKLEVQVFPSQKINMSYSLHDKRLKTQRVFKGWDYSEIIEWMEVEEKLTIKNQLFHRLNIFFKDIKKSFKNLFQWILNDEEMEIKKTKKAIDYLMKKCWEESCGSYKLTEKEREKIGGLRTYMRRLSRFKNSYLHPLWEGLYKIEDDETFLKYISHFLESLWD